MAKIVGIDLGTTNSVIAVMEGGEPTVIPLAEGSRLCPSVVGFSKSGERLVGQLAKRQAITNPDRTIASIKRHMGSDYRVTIDDKNYSPQEISAMILQKLKADAEAFLGDKVDRAVITVPAYFNDAQRQATKDAGQIAGLEVLRIINEPTAAALAYGMDKEGVHTILVWDLGGGTFDVSILELGEGVFEVKSTNGDTRLGGDDWDDRVMEWMAGEFQRETGVDLRKDKMAAQRLKEAAEKAKIELSTLSTTNVNLPFISTTAEGPVHLDLNLSRSQFEQQTEDLREKMLPSTRQALEDAKLEPSQIDKIVLVGGSTRMPAVQDMVRQMFNQEPYKGTNPDEVVALGAAVQAGVLGGEVRDIVLLDVTPLSLGIETLGGVMTKLIARNRTIPTSETQVFTTAADGQAAVDIHVLQGEREFVTGNNSLGRFQLSGIPPAPRGVPKIEVAFEIDANGIVNVSAKDQATGKQTRITITASSGLSKDAIDRMIRDAELHADEDKKRKDDQEARNHADTLLYNSEKTFTDADGKISPDLLQTARDAASSLRAGLGDSATSSDVLRERTEALTTAVYAVSSALYQAGATVPNAASASNGYASDAADLNNGAAPSGYATDAQFDSETGPVNDGDGYDSAERTTQFTSDLNGEPEPAGVGGRSANANDDVVEGEFRVER